MKKNGFTLIELLLVISIISLLSTIIFASLNSARIKAYDAATLSQVKSYQNSFFIAETADGLLPDPAAHDTWYCLGKLATETCTFWGLTFHGSDTLTNIIGRISTTPAIPTVTVDSLGYNAIVYKCSQIHGNSGPCEAALYWPQFNGSTCNKGKVVLTGVGGTICGQDVGDFDTTFVESKPGGGCGRC